MFATCSANSTTLIEYPHSLSYQANTLTLLSPMTIVDCSSTIAECGSVLKSIETNGSSLTAIIPANSPLLASLSASFTFSIVTSVFKSTTKSTKETFEVGTLNAIPCILLSNSGNTSDKAFAARVEVGIMLSVQERAHLKSLGGLSKIIYSFVKTCTVVIKPFSIPNLSFKTLVTGLKQFVVQEAFEIISNSFKLS